MIQFAAGEEIVPMFAAEQIAERIKVLGGEISRDFAGEQITLVVTLKGAFMFAADLARYLCPLTRIEFVKVSSYGSRTRGGDIKLDYATDTPFLGKHVVLIEDIVDTGHTARFILQLLQSQQPAALKLCALLEKPARREDDGIKIDYLGFSIPDKFVVGYGLDFDERYRNLPYIAEVVLPK